MVLSLVFAGFDGQLLGQGSLPDQRWSGVKHAENSKDFQVQVVTYVTAKVDLFSGTMRKLLLLARNRQGSWNWFGFWGQGPERDSPSVYSCELGLLYESISGRESSVEKLSDPYATDGSMCEGAFQGVGPRALCDLCYAQRFVGAAATAR